MKGRDSLPPIVFQVLGLTMAVFFVGFWAVTDRVEPTLLGVAITLFSVGLVQRASALLPEKRNGTDTTKPDRNEAV